MEENNGMKVIGKYSYFLSSCLGQGSFGKVFQGFENTTKTKVAIKKVDLKIIEKDSYLEKAIYSQIKILNKLKHPNIVELYDVLNSKRSLYIVTEFCQHGDLKKYLQKKGRLAENEAYQVMIQIVEGFKQLLKQKVIHRDLKPANILIHNNVYKICDFGFSKYVDSTMDTLKSCVGSPIYMAPQILERQKYTYKCDIWSLGIIYFELLHGSVPWKGANQMDLLKNIKTIQLRMADCFSDQLVSFLRSLLCYQQDKRATWEDVFAYFSKRPVSPLKKQPSNMMLEPATIISPKGVPPKTKILLTKYFFEELAFRSLTCIKINQKHHRLACFSLSKNLVDKFILLLSASIRFKTEQVKQEVDRLHDVASQYSIKQQFSHYNIFHQDFLQRLRNSPNGQDLTKSSSPQYVRLLDGGSVTSPQQYQSLLKQSLSKLLDQLSEEQRNANISDKVFLQQTIQTLMQITIINEYYTRSGEIPYQKIFKDKDLNKSESRSSSKQEGRKFTKNAFFS